MTDRPTETGHRETSNNLLANFWLAFKFQIISNYTFIFWQNQNHHKNKKDNTSTPARNLKVKEFVLHTYIYLHLEIFAFFRLHVPA